MISANEHVILREPNPGRANITLQRSKGSRRSPSAAERVRWAKL